MGQFIVHVDAIGNHGCQREKKDGEHVVGCEQPGCTDCITREFVRRLKRSGAMINSARLVHWPGQNKEWPSAIGQVEDDLLTGKRTGSF